jgi:hypothetical protein
VALELHVRDGKPLLESAVEAARARFRPILMTSFAFILGVVPLVLATGAGAKRRKSIGITVFSGMLASTCLAVLFVPTFFVVVQRFENGSRRARRRRLGFRPRRKRRPRCISRRRPGQAMRVDRRVGKAQACGPSHSAVGDRWWARSMRSFAHPTPAHREQRWSVTSAGVPLSHARAHHK